MDELFRRNELLWMLEEEYYNMTGGEISRFMTDKFQQRTYGLWAIEELIAILNSDDNKHPIDIISDFASKMDNYACMAHPDVRWIFSIAYDTAMNALDFAISLY